MPSLKNIPVFGFLILFLFLHFPSQSHADHHVSLPPSSSPSPSPSPTDLWKTICNKLDTDEDKSFCKKIMQSNKMLASKDVDIKTMANVTLEITKNQTTSVVDFFRALFKNNKTKSEFKPDIKVCLIQFNSAITELSLRGLEDGTATLDVHYALDAVQSCKTGLHSEVSRAFPEIENQIQRWKHYYNIAYAAVEEAEDVYSQHPWLN